MIKVGCPGESVTFQTAYQIRRQLENNFIQLFEAETFEEYIKHAQPLYDNPVQRELGFVSALWNKTNWKNGLRH